MIDENIDNVGDSPSVQQQVDHDEEQPRNISEQGENRPSHQHNNHRFPSPNIGLPHPPPPPPAAVPPVPPMAAISPNPSAVREEAENIVDAVQGDFAEALNLREDEDEMGHLLLHQIGRAHYGIGACETYVWLNPRLVPVGWYVDDEILSNYNAATTTTDAATSSDERELLTSKPHAAVANIDLVGALWSMSATLPADQELQLTHVDARRNLLRKHQSQRMLLPKHQQPLHSAPLEWRDIKTLIQDPYQSHGTRTEALYKAGLALAAGITFNVFGICGMVVWYAKAGIDYTLLTDPIHENYLRKASHMKGALLASIGARQQCVELLEESGKLLPKERQHHSNAVVREAIVASETSTSSNENCFRTFAWKKQQVHAWLAKIRGGGAQIPPCMSWSETTWTFVGSFIGLLCVAFLHKAVRLLSDDEYFLILGPLAAIVMLQYGLPGSPAGQPRTVFWGQVIAGITAIPLNYIPDQNFPKWIRMIVAVTLAIGAMMKLGYACPPAAATSLIYAQKDHGWKMWGLALLASCISFAPAILFNNLNPKRIYPTFWGLHQEKAVKVIRKYVARKS